MEFIDALARLLADRDLRHRYQQDEPAAARELSLTDEARMALAALSLDELERQAEGLISKRRTAVSNLIPRTWQRLGSQHAVELFNEFANTHWPVGHRRHQEDAMEFCRFLSARRLSVVKPEWRWLRFMLNRRWLRLYFSTDLLIRSESHSGIHIMYRWKGEPRWYMYGIRNRRFRKTAT